MCGVPAPAARTVKTLKSGRYRAPAERWRVSTVPSPSGQLGFAVLCGAVACHLIHVSVVAAWCRGGPLRPLCSLEAPPQTFVFHPDSNSKCSVTCSRPLCRHAKRSTITTEDVKLLARRSNSLVRDESPSPTPLEYIIRLITRRRVLFLRAPCIKNWRRSSRSDRL